MRKGSVIIDLAAATGGNTPVTKEQSNGIVQWRSHYRQQQPRCHHAIRCQ